MGHTHFLFGWPVALICVYVCCIVPPSKSVRVFPSPVTRAFAICIRLGVVRRSEFACVHLQNSASHRNAQKKTDIVYDDGVEIFPMWYFRLWMWSFRLLISQCSVCYVYFLPNTIHPFYMFCRSRLSSYNTICGSSSVF